MIIIPILLINFFCGGEKSIDSVEKYEPVSFSLLAPRNFTRDISLTPTFTWEKSSFADKYIILVATDKDFTSLVIQTSNIDKETTSYSIPEGSFLTKNTSYYWKIIAINGDAQIESSQSPYAFTTVDTTVVEEKYSPEIFHLLDTGTLTNGQNGIDPANPIDLNWGQSEYAAKYIIEISEDLSFFNKIDLEGLGLNEKIVSDPPVPTDREINIPGGTFAADKTYYIRITAENDNGIKIADNAPYSFNTKTPETFQLTSPVYREYNVGSNPVLAWDESGNADIYTLLVANNPDFTNCSMTDTTGCVYEANNVIDEFHVVTTALNGSLYYWKVFAENNLALFSSAAAIESDNNLSFFTGFYSGVETFTDLNWTEVGNNTFADVINSPDYGILGNIQVVESLFDNFDPDQFAEDLNDFMDMVYNEHHDSGGGITWSHDLYEIYSDLAELCLGDGNPNTEYLPIMTVEFGNALENFYNYVTSENVSTLNDLFGTGNLFDKLLFIPDEPVMHSGLNELTTFLKLIKNVEELSKDDFAVVQNPSGTLIRNNGEIVEGSIKIVIDGKAIGAKDSEGSINGSDVTAGIIDYNTGAISFNLVTAPSTDVKVEYDVKNNDNTYKWDIFSDDQELGTIGHEGINSIIGLINLGKDIFDGGSDSIEGMADLSRKIFDQFESDDNIESSVQQSIDFLDDPDNYITIDGSSILSLEKNITDWLAADTDKKTLTEFVINDLYPLLTNRTVGGVTDFMLTGINHFTTISKVLSASPDSLGDPQNDDTLLLRYLFKGIYADINILHELDDSAASGYLNIFEDISSSEVLTWLDTDIIQNRLYPVLDIASGGVGPLHKDIASPVNFNLGFKDLLWDGWEYNPAAGAVAELFRGMIQIGTSDPDTIHKDDSNLVKIAKTKSIDPIKKSFRVEMAAKLSGITNLTVNESYSDTNEGILHAVIKNLQFYLMSKYYSTPDQKWNLFNDDDPENLLVFMSKTMLAMRNFVELDDMGNSADNDNLNMLGEILYVLGIADGVVSPDDCPGEIIVSTALKSMDTSLYLSDYMSITAKLFQGAYPSITMNMRALGNNSVYRASANLANPDQIPANWVPYATQNVTQAFELIQHGNFRERTGGRECVNAAEDTILSACSDNSFNNQNDCESNSACSDNLYNNQIDCEGNSATWAPTWDGGVDDDPANGILDPDECTANLGGKYKFVDGLTGNIGNWKGNFSPAQGDLLGTLRGEPFDDLNNNGSWDTGEPYTDKNNNDKYDTSYASTTAWVISQISLACWEGHGPFTYEGKAPNGADCKYNSDWYTDWFKIQRHWNFVTGGTDMGPGLGEDMLMFAEECKVWNTGDSRIIDTSIDATPLTNTSLIAESIQIRVGSRIIDAISDAGGNITGTNDITGTGTIDEDNGTYNFTLSPTVTLSDGDPISITYKTVDDLNEEGRYHVYEKIYRPEDGVPEFEDSSFDNALGDNITKSGYIRDSETDGSYITYDNINWTKITLDCSTRDEAIKKNLQWLLNDKKMVAVMPIHAHTKKQLHGAINVYAEVFMYTSIIGNGLKGLMNAKKHAGFTTSPLIQNNAVWDSGLSGNIFKKDQYNAGDNYYLNTVDEGNSTVRYSAMSFNSGDYCLALDYRYFLDAGWDLINQITPGLIELTDEIWNALGSNGFIPAILSENFDVLETLANSEYTLADITATPAGTNITKFSPFYSKYYNLVNDGTNFYYDINKNSTYDAGTDIRIKDKDLPPVPKITTATYPATYDAITGDVATWSAAHTGSNEGIFEQLVALTAIAAGTIHEDGTVHVYNKDTDTQEDLPSGATLDDTYVDVNTYYKYQIIYHKNDGYRYRTNDLIQSLLILNETQNIGGAGADRDEPAYNNSSFLNLLTDYDPGTSTINPGSRLGLIPELLKSEIANIQNLHSFKYNVSDIVKTLSRNFFNKFELTKGPLANADLEEYYTDEANTTRNTIDWDVPLNQIRYLITDRENIYKILDFLDYVKDITPIAGDTKIIDIIKEMVSTSSGRAEALNKLFKVIFIDKQLDIHPGWGKSEVVDFSDLFQFDLVDDDIDKVIAFLNDFDYRTFITYLIDHDLNDPEILYNFNFSKLDSVTAADLKTHLDELNEMLVKYFSINIKEGLIDGIYKVKDATGLPAEFDVDDIVWGMGKYIEESGGFDGDNGYEYSYIDIEADILPGGIVDENKFEILFPGLRKYFRFNSNNKYTDKWYRDAVDSPDIYNLFHLDPKIDELINLIFNEGLYKLEEADFTANVPIAADERPESITDWLFGWDSTSNNNGVDLKTELNYIKDSILDETYDVDINIYDPAHPDQDVTDNIRYFIGSYKDFFNDNLFEYSINDEGNENIGTGDDSTVTFSGTLTTVPLGCQIEEGTITIKVNDIPIDADDALGAIAGTDIVDGTGTINYDTGAISIDFVTPPANGENVDVLYRCIFEKETYEVNEIAGTHKHALNNLAEIISVVFNPDHSAYMIDTLYTALVPGVVDEMGITPAEFTSLKDITSNLLYNDTPGEYTKIISNSLYKSSDYKIMANIMRKFQGKYNQLANIIKILIDEEIDGGSGFGDYLFDTLDLDLAANLGLDINNDGYLEDDLMSDLYNNILHDPIFTIYYDEDSFWYQLGELFEDISIYMQP